MALIDKDGHNFWLEECSSVRFEACFEFPAKSLHKERKKERKEDTCKICSSVVVLYNKSLLSNMKNSH